MDNPVKNFYQKYKNWPYSNTAMLLLSLILLYYFTKNPAFGNFIFSIGSLGYFGAFLCGIFFVSIFTVAPSAVILFEIAKMLDPVLVAILAGLGAVIGDYIIFQFLKDRVFTELAPVFDKLGGSLIKKIFASPYFAWFLPIMGAVIIASPMPDEIGISMIGLSKVKTWQFIVVSFALNAIGIFILISLANIKTMF